MNDRNELESLKVSANDLIDFEGLEQAHRRAVASGKMPPGDAWLTPRGAKKVVLVLEPERQEPQQPPVKGDAPSVELCFRTGWFMHQVQASAFALYSALYLFIKNFCIVTLDPQDTIPKEEFAVRFNAFCLGGHCRLYNPIALGREMRIMGVENGQRGRPRRRYWIGIAWQDLPQDEILSILRQVCTPPE